MADAYDLFISYPHVGNKGDSWIDKFHALLRTQLTRRGLNPRIWHDSNLRIGDYINDSILVAARHSTFFVAVTSPAWVKSVHCTKELEAYLESHPTNGRVFCAEQLPDTNLPRPLNEILREPFYRLTFRFPQSFRPTLGGPFETAVTKMAADIAYAITSPVPDMESFVQDVRQRVNPSIQRRCGIMRILTMEQPIDLGGIYTAINVLQSSPRHQRRSLREMSAALEEGGYEARIGLAPVVERLPATEVVDSHSQLMILGGPGTGKTTFLRRVAYLCAKGDFRPHLIPVYLEFRVLGESTLLDAIRATFQLEPESLLRAGRVLLLLDGLDELSSKAFPRVRDEIEAISSRYQHCPILMTCRIAAREYVFQQFREVEIAQFDKAQREEFTKKWYDARQHPEKTATFLNVLEANAALLELAQNPLLLTLLCLIFEERMDFDGDRAELYREGFEVLLRKWDASRHIEREQTYRKLTRARKEDLLARIAFRYFCKAQYFFPQEHLERDIRTFFSALDGQEEEVDPTAVLRSIEAQHGLLVERAHRIYSFSHLTFQEYLTARRIVDRHDPTWRYLLPHISDKRWREVFLLAAAIVSPVDNLLLPLKESLEPLVASSERLQRVIKWVGLKQRSLHAPYRDSTVRAFYLATFCANGKDILFGGLEQAHALDAARGGALKDAVQSDKSLSDAIDAVLELTTTIDCHLDSGINRMFTVDVDRPRAFDFALDLARADAVEKVIVAIQRRAQAYNHARASTKTREPPALESPPPQVMKALESLASEARLGKADGRWPERLRSVVSEYGYARYSDAKLKLATTDINVLDQYREGYLRLAECLHAAREVSPSVREYIHKTFLLPWNELRQIPKPKPEESDVY